jgi:hypothetical protein
MRSDTRPVSGMRPTISGEACPHASTCAMFDLFSSREILNVWRENYCQESFRRCARYRLSCGGYLVPLTLLPNGRELHVDERWLKSKAG